jgi:ribosome modulation factor
MDEVEQFWEDQLKRRAFAEGQAALFTGAANPYVAVTARQAWRDGYDDAKSKQPATS